MTNPIDNRIKDLDYLLVEALRAAEMRQGCTNYTYFAEILRKQICQLLSVDDKDLEKEIIRILGEEPPNGTCTKEATGCPDLKIPTCKECAKLQILALLPKPQPVELRRLREKLTEVEKKLNDRELDLKEAKREERERIINLLQDLLEMSEKNKEPSIKVKMINILQALKGEK